MGKWMCLSRTPLHFSFHLPDSSCQDVCLWSWQGFTPFAFICIHLCAEPRLSNSPLYSLGLVSLGGRRTPREEMRVGWWKGHPGPIPGQLGWSCVLQQAGSPRKKDKRESGVHSRPIMLVPLRKDASL